MNSFNLERENILDAFYGLGSDLVALRSSAVGENGSLKSFAGQYKTILNVTSEELIDAAIACRESLNSVHEVLFIIQKRKAPLKDKTLRGIYS